MTIMTEFMLMGFPGDWIIQKLHAALFFLIYLAALMGNLLIVILTSIDQQLQAPMYFFLKNLSLIDICYISVTVPKSIMNSLNNSHSISFLGCASQVYFVIFFAGAEYALLIVMSYDRYAAICCPLHYENIMNRDTCVHMVTASWLIGCVYGSIHVAGTFSVNFCGSNVVYQFFCDFCAVPSLLTLACSEKQILEYTFVTYSFLYLLFMISSFFHSISAFLRILLPQTKSRFKIISTCIYHLIMVTLAAFSGIVIHLDTNKSAPPLNLFMSVYILLLSSLTLLVYNLSNRDVKVAFAILLASKMQLLWYL
ncbi:putative olfactory receptor 14L1 [Orycteropus afer afer]|uniref:Olfactory receptor 14L1 n=1 Tax=Orycteropus afer afer TaxID=1230840 RepID=A0AC54Z7A9_ORYAF|nr:putative olfactory receptor 14L1 [Orycteropus afer afer]